MKYDLDFDQQGPLIIDDETREPVLHSDVIEENAALREENEKLKQDLDDQIGLVTTNGAKYMACLKALRKSNDFLKEYHSNEIEVDVPVIEQITENKKLIGGE